MTDAPADRPTDREARPIETTSGTVVSEETLSPSTDRDRQVEVPADHDAEPIGSASGPVSDAEHVAISPDPDNPAAISQHAACTERAGADPTANVVHEPASADASAAFQDDASVASQAEASAASQDDPTSPSQADASPPSQNDPAATVPVAAAPPLRDPDEAALRMAEAAVFASATPMTPRALSQILPDDLDPAAVIAALRVRYEGRGLELCEIGGGLQFRTAADLAPQLRKVVQVPRRLPRVALETLAIVAYHQPITRPEIEDLRGTGLSQQTLDVLLENDLIVTRGRKETPGRPTLWGTTAKFLEYFGLRDIRELPRRQDLLLEAIRPEAEAEAYAVPPEGSPS